MKGKDFIDPKTQEYIEQARQDRHEPTPLHNTCSLCNVHDQAVEKLPKDENICFKCPKCNKYINFDKDGTPIVGDGPHMDTTKVYEYVNDFTVKGMLLDSSQVIGETNNGFPEIEDENFERGLILRCPHCDAHLTPVLMEIIYNANHDIYYTGGKRSLPELHGLCCQDDEFVKNVKACIKQYSDRIKEGELLDESNLWFWIKADIENVIAKILFEQGFKR